MEKRLTFLETMLSLVAATISGRDTSYYLLRLSRAAGFQATREQSLLSSDRREADILIANWEGTRPLAVDLTIRHPRTPGLPFRDPKKC